MGHALGAPSRDTRALARIPPECRGEHRGIGNLPASLLKHARARLLVRGCFAGIPRSDCFRGAFHSCSCTVMGSNNIDCQCFESPISVRTGGMAVVRARAGRRESTSSRLGPFGGPTELPEQLCSVCCDDEFYEQVGAGPACIFDDTTYDGTSVLTRPGGAQLMA
jgi:hypothetical protein